MDVLDRRTILSLADQQEGPCVSLFMPTHPAGLEAEQDAIRLNNLLREAENALAGHWMRASEARDFLEAAHALPLDATFWKHRGDGLAVFVGPNVFRAFRVPRLLPERVFVSRRFRMRPLLPLLEQQHAFFLLAISENQVGFYAVDQQSINKVEINGLPSNMSDTLNYVAVDRGSQVHSATGLPAGKQGGVFHGQGGAPDVAKDNQLAYCAAIEQSVTKWLGLSTQPLLLACVAPLAALYRQKNSYQHLLEVTLTGNHDYDSPHVLQTQGWALVEPILTSAAANGAHRYANQLGTSRAIDQPAEVLPAALHGRVDSLLYNPHAELFGVVDAAGLAVEVTGNADDEDLVDLAAVETLRQGGAIHAMTDEQTSPTNQPLAAILRW